jgi:paraquat-inducible protein B
VTGLETLLSGAYIAIDPATEGTAERDFVGLEEPPLFTTSEPGRKLVLRSAALGSLNIGSPVYHRDIQVGQVVGYQLDPGGAGVSIDIFIAAPHDELVRTTSRFWNVSGVEVRLSAEGVAVDTQSLLALMIGGIGFDTPELLDPGAVAEEGTHFPLYASREQAHERTFLYKERYLLYFSGSVRGLEVGAPVLLRGIRVGQVLDVELKLDLQDFAFRIPVLVEVEPERVGLIGDRGPLKVEAMVERLVQQGLRGQLKSGNLLTGALYVDLDFHPDAPSATITREGDYRVVPTVAAPLDAVATKANQFLDTLLALPLEAIGGDLRATLQSTRELVESPELMAALAALERALIQVGETASSYRGLTPRIEEALRQTQESLAAAETFVGADSAMSGELRVLLRELSAAARSIRAMADYLERHPEALLKGKGGMR